MPDPKHHQVATILSHRNDKLSTQHTTTSLSALVLAGVPQQQTWPLQATKFYSSTPAVTRDTTSTNPSRSSSPVLPTTSPKPNGTSLSPTVPIRPPRQGTPSRRTAYLMGAPTPVSIHPRTRPPSGPCTLAPGRWAAALATMVL